MGEAAQSSPGELVCVTGANGFLASCLVKCLLERGYYVRATVRDLGNADKVSHLLRLPGASERLELREADLLTEGSFDDVVRGCRRVFHTASPVTAFTVDPEVLEMIAPAVNGTLNVLKSCAKSPSVRRVVLTSSTSAIRFMPEMPSNSVLDDTSWSSEDFCRKYKMWYYLAKTVAERKAWEFAEKNNLDLVTVLPSFVVGPVLPKNLSSTALDVLGLLKGTVCDVKKFSIYPRMGYVHVEDVALAHILVMEAPGARGRYICSSTVMDNDKLGELLAMRYPQFNVPTKFPESYKSKYYTLDTSKLEKLGLKFRSVEDMFDDCLENFYHRGLFSLTDTLY
ncbi:hypothetical protein SELMODRAFT_74610 [Selaginella moellendorffii]|uniref:NAD-dependent epimerase/dehydratase domain-containing protein n=1 Tax=Selaginella moellendorffii TaxID=88036 RepID=D8QQ07_SELML|nr:hypothetical protein SELMODRAFT_74610 [Selaginella moellendorffii]